MSTPLTTLPPSSSPACLADDSDESSSLASLSSPLIRALHKDADTQFQLFEFLILNEIAMLARCSRVWSAWLRSDRAMGKRQRELKPSQIHDLIQCKWVLRPIETIIFAAEEDPDDDGRREINILPEERALSAALSALALHLPWLIELHLTTRICHIPDVRLHLAGLPKLVRLTIVVPDSKQIVNASDRFVRSVLNSVSVLRDLELLHFEGFIDYAEHLDFSELPLLPKLRSFACFTTSPEYVCTAEQAECLSRCPSLTDLNCGCWSPQVDHTLDPDEIVPADQQLETGIGMLVRRTTRVREDGTPFAGLAAVVWNATVMSAALWSYVVKIPTLASLWFGDWQVGLTADQWMQMPRFKSLQVVSIFPMEFEEDEEGKFKSGASLIKSEDFMPALLLCTTIKRLQLGERLRITAAQMESIACSLTSLERLTLYAAWVESLEPLRLAPVLSSDGAPLPGSRGWRCRVARQCSRHSNAEPAGDRRCRAVAVLRRADRCSQCDSQGQAAVAV